MTGGNPGLGPEMNAAGDEDTPAGAGLTRRRALKGAATGLLAASSAGLLAACGSSNKSSSSASSSSAPAGGSGTSSSSGAASSSGSGSTGSGPVATGDGAQLKALLSLPTGKAAGQGLSIPLGGDYALSGPSAAYGLEQYHGVLMAIPHVAAAGGPNFKLKALNTNDVTSGTANVRQFGSAGITLIITSQGGGFGGALPFYPQYEMFAMDCGGAGKINEGKANFYQGSPERNNAFIAIALKYMQAKMPKVKKLAFVDLDLGTQSKLTEDETTAQCKAAGYTIQYTRSQLGTTDFSSVLSQVRQMNPDLVISNEVLGTDMGLFMKQYQTSGLKVPVIGLDYTVGAAKLAGAAFATNFYFSAQYFTPKTKWGELFATAFEKKFHYSPNYYNANYYQAVFWYWELVRRVIAAGKDPSKAHAGQDFITAFNSGLNFPSVYGTSGEVGTASFNKETHTLDHQLMIFGKGGANNNPTLLASSDVDGSNFKLSV